MVRLIIYSHIDSIDYFHLRCEKGLEGNRCLKYYNLEERGKKRLADGIGYVVADNTESMLIESSG